MASTPVTTATYVPSVAKPASYRAQSVKNRRVGEITSRAFNNFPAIMAAFPAVLSGIVIETTEAVGNNAAARAPVGTARAGAPPPGTLHDSKKTRYFNSRDGDVLSGRIDFKAQDPNGKDPHHLYAWYEEWGSIHNAAHPFLVPALIDERPKFNDRLGQLEDLLPGPG